MQSFDTESDDALTPAAARKQELIIGAIGDVPPGRCATVELPDGEQLAVFNVDGEFYAIENFCPHKGAPLSEGSLCGHVVECGWHGWEFDVRTGQCLTVTDKIRTYPLKIVDGIVSVEI